MWINVLWILWLTGSHSHRNTFYILIYWRWRIFNQFMKILTNHLRIILRICNYVRHWRVFWFIYLDFLVITRYRCSLLGLIFIDCFWRKSWIWNNLNILNLIFGHWLLLLILNFIFILIYHMVMRWLWALKWYCRII